MPDATAAFGTFSDSPVDSSTVDFSFALFPNVLLILYVVFAFISTHKNCRLLNPDRQSPTVKT